MPHKGRSINSQYEGNSLDNAVTAVKHGMSYRQAALKFGVPKSTIRDRVTCRVREGTTPGKKTAIPLEVEAELASALKSAASQGFG